MGKIEEYKRLEGDRLQGKGKAPASSQYYKEYRLEKFQQRARKAPRAPGVGSTHRIEGVNMTFKEPIYKILKRIKNEPYFRWAGTW